uniref:Neuron navigator 1 n=1 Tax=Oncorhynchus tshawytscha TaxID=74940 RepID=A0A8C8JC08_ONCTS
KEGRVCMLRSSVKGGREGDLKMERAESTKTYGQAEGKAVGVAAKRGKSGMPQSAQRGELRVYRAGSSEGRLPVSSNLRKQRSLTNLAVLTDAEKKMHLYEPKWCDDMAKPGAGHLKTGKPKLAGGGGSGGGGGAPLSRNLSKSEHSLFQGKPKPFSPLVAPSGLVRPGQSRIPRGPYAEVKPLSKAPEDGKSDDEILSSKAKAVNKKQVAGASGEAGAKGQGDGSQSFLKVDPELVVTVLGDLEQLLFSQMLDPESQRKRTVQNVLDLRQNLEDTMSSLRGAQLSHGSNVCYDSDETNARSMSSLSNRSSPLSWRHGQSSPRLQAGDAPSSTGSGVYHGGKAGSQYTAHTMPARVSSRLSHSSRIELIEGLDVDDADLKSGYLSDSDLLGKSMPEDDDDNLANGWDESSSISSGLSDGSVDNLSSEEFNASSSLNSLPTTPLGSRRNSSVMLRTDAEKRSLVESGLSWYSEDAKAARKMDGSSYETGSLKTETPSKWRKSSRPMEGASEDVGVKGELRKPQSLGQPGNFKKGRNPPVGVTSPITHTSQSVLKVAGEMGSFAVDKNKMSVKAAGLQRSRSDAGREHLPEHREHRKPPSGLVKPSAGASFGYKRSPTTGTATVMTAGGSTISSGSATVGKIPKSSGIPVKPMGVGGGGKGGRKNSFDATGSEEGGFLGPNARNSLQYRSLPRPAKSSTLSLIGRPGSARPASSSIDPGLLSLKPVSMACPGPKRKEPGSGSTKGASRGGSTGPVNQTDREKEKERAKAKAVASDMDSLCGSLKMEDCLGDSTGEASTKLQGLRRASSSKYPELSSPTSQRMLSCKSLGRPPSLAHLDKVNSNSLDSCVTIQDLPPKVPPYSKLQDLAGSGSRSPAPRGLTPSPAPILHLDSPSCYPSQTLSLGGSPLLYPKLSGLHRSMESLPLTMSVPPSGGYIRAESRDRDRDREEVRGTGTWVAGSRTSLNLPDSLQTDRNTLPKKGLGRYSSGPSEGQSEGKERRHSHTAVSLTESESPPQLPSPTHMPHLSSGKAHLTNVVHGSVLSLASNASSNYSSQIRKLRRELENSQEKVANLTTQLSANVCRTGFSPFQPLSHTPWSSFNKAFSKKGSKLSASYADIEEIATPDSSAPSSPKIPIHHVDRDGDGEGDGDGNGDISMMRLCEGGEEPPEDEKVVTTLRSALWEKERKLTDIRLEALSSAHQLEQLQEAMNNMQVLENLKAENDQLKTGGPSTSTSQSSGLPDLFGSAGLYNKYDGEPFNLSTAPVLVQQEVKQQDFFIGTVRVNGRMDWPMLDSAVGQAFKVYIAKVDPTSSLGLTTDSVYSYSMNHIRRVLGGELPESQPSRCVSKGPSGITVTLKGLKEKCVDSLVFETLIPKPMTQHYISLLLKHRRLIMSGPSGTGKTYLTSRLAEYLVDRSGRDLNDGIVVTFNMHRQSCKDLQLCLSNLANQIDRETSTAEIPLVVILDDIHDATSISELVNGALTCKYHKCPYIIGTTNQPVKMTPNHGLHLSFRMVTFSNNVEPANGFLVRYLHRKLMEAEDERSLANEDLLRVLDWVPKLWYHLHTFLEKHSTSDFLIGPCFFLSCPVTVEEFRSWFIDLWNLSIIPYLQEGAKDGIKVHGQKAVWEDPVEWVRGTLPWPSAQQDQAKLFHLPPPSMTSGGPGQPSEASARPLNKETPPSSMDTLDPLMAMLLKLQEAANCIESPDRETMDPSLPTF